MLYWPLAARLSLQPTTETLPTIIMSSTPIDRRFCIAPMLDWTDSACRGFHRLLTRQALLREFWRSMMRSSPSWMSRSSTSSSRMLRMQ